MFADSRCEGIFEELQKVEKKEFIGFWTHNWANLWSLAEDAELHLKNYPFDVMYIMGGVCDITYKNHNTGEVSYQWASPAELNSHLVSTLRRIDQGFIDRFPASKVIFCTLVGVDLRRVVTKHGITDEQQQGVNNAIFDFNDEIFTINARRGTFSPSLHRTIHRSKNVVRKSYYEGE